MINFKDLPVYKSKDQILDALSNNQVVVVESPTGSGKTTQIPLILYEAGYTNEKMIGITQPRRIATISVSSFISNQLQELSLSESYCAYKMRFYDTTTSSTKIKILTDGMLLQEIKADPLLNSYSVIMIDEAHERSLNIDFLIGLLKQVLELRKDLKLIISSATINTKIFSKFFSNAPIISISTKTYDVKIKYIPLKEYDTDTICYAICQIVNVLLKNFKDSNYLLKNDILVFLPGEFDIKTSIQYLYEKCDFKHLQIYPLYSRLNKEEQESVFQPTENGKLKIVLATNIAETSITIDGIKVVIDSGLSKINFYNQYDYTSSLVTRPISKSSAMQRSGRAGRTSDGLCYRLYSEEDYKKRLLYTPEEILRTDLSEVVLRMVDLGIKNFESFPFITSPKKNAIISGEKTLKLLGAIDNDRELTDIGKLMVKYPLLPRHSRCIYEAIKIDCDMIKPVIICVSFLSCKTPFILPPGEEDAARQAHRSFHSLYGDFISYQFLYKKYIDITKKEDKEKFCNNYYLDIQCMDEIVHVTEQLCQITREIGIPVINFDPCENEIFAKRCLTLLCSGLIQYICIRKNKTVYKNLNTDEIYIHPGSAFFRDAPEFLIAGEIVLTSKMYARTVSPLKKEWIEEFDYDLFQSLKRISNNNSTTKITKINNNKTNQKSYTLFGTKLNIVYDLGKKSKPIVEIPVNKINLLLKTYKKSSRKPKNIFACIKYYNYYLCYNEKLHDVLLIGNKFNFDNCKILKEIPDSVYVFDKIDSLKKYLNLLLCLSPLKKYKNRLGFIELVYSKNGYFFHVNNSFNDAINNTAYSLLNLIDDYDDKNFKQHYNRIIKFLD